MSEYIICQTRRNYSLNNGKLNHMPFCPSDLLILRLVGKHVPLQSTWECEWFVAQFASVRHLSGMGRHVCLQILRSRKGLPTIITFVRLLACVSSGFHVAEMISRRLCICALSLQCEFPCASSKLYSFQMTCRRLHTCLVSVQCDLPYAASGSL